MLCNCIHVPVYPVDCPCSTPVEIPVRTKSHCRVGEPATADMVYIPLDGGVLFRLH